MNNEIPQKLVFGNILLYFVADSAGGVLFVIESWKPFMFGRI